MSTLLGVNVDHVATLREARKSPYPDPVEAALLCEKAGCHGITAHLREDERHIKEADIFELKKRLTTRLNLEMSIHPRIVEIAKQVKAPLACLVPENREEVTTEGGLDVMGQFKAVKDVVKALGADGTEVSLFIDPDKDQIAASIEAGAPAIEIHSGTYANSAEPEKELAVIGEASEYAHSLGLKVNAGHGLTVENTPALVEAFSFYELNIGHSIIARSVFIGLDAAVKEILNLIKQ